MPVTQEGNVSEFWDDDIDGPVDDEWHERMAKIQLRREKEGKLQVLETTLKGYEIEDNFSKLLRISIANLEEEIEGLQD